MADIYCPRCAEPVEIDYLHDVADKLGASFTDTCNEFRRIGCAALKGLTDPTCERVRSARTAAIREVMEWSDWPDDWATDLDDLIMGGLI